MKQLILASQSPRRNALLTQLGYQFSTSSADIDESVQCNEQAKDYVVRLAKEKAEAIFLALPMEEQAQVVVLGADTSVVVDDMILGKPDNEADCLATLLRLSNKQHQVLTAIAVIYQESSQEIRQEPSEYQSQNQGQDQGQNQRQNQSQSKNKQNKVISTLVETQVQFKTLTVGEIKEYWRTGEPCDKAGSYAIQGIGGQFVTTINGSYSAVVGLPLYETVQLLAQAGLPSSLSNA